MYFLNMYKAKALALYKMLDQDAFSCTVWYCVRAWHYIIKSSFSCITYGCTFLHYKWQCTYKYITWAQCDRRKLWWVYSTLYTVQYIPLLYKYMCTLWPRKLVPTNVYTCTLWPERWPWCTRVHYDLEGDPDVHVYTMTWNVTLVYMCIVYTLTLV